MSPGVFVALPPFPSIGKSFLYILYFYIIAALSVFPGALLIWFMILGNETVLCQ